MDTGSNSQAGNQKRKSKEEGKAKRMMHPSQRTFKSRKDILRPNNLALSLLVLWKMEIRSWSNGLKMYGCDLQWMEFVLTFGFVDP